MTDQNPLGSHPPNLAEGNFPPPPPGPPPSDQPTFSHAPQPASSQVQDQSSNPTATDEETRQQQEMLDHWKREHERKLSGQPPTEPEHQPAPPQPLRPIPAYDPSAPQFEQASPVHFPEDHQHQASANAFAPTGVPGGDVPIPGGGAPAPIAGAGAPPPGAHGGPSPTQGHTAGDEQDAKGKSSWSTRFATLGVKAAAPINQLAHKLGSQSFLPETMGKECDKAADILSQFCKSGVTADPSAESQLPAAIDPSNATEKNDGIIDPTKEKPKNRVIVTIPPKVIKRALGIAIFTTLRAGFNFTGSTGSGILIARLPDGTWGPPSGIQVHSVGGGFSIGVDIYDCVCVINSKEALKAFTGSKVSLGSDLAVTAGPYGAGGAVGVGIDGRKEKGAEGTTPPPPPAAAATAADEGLKPAEDKKSHRRSLSASGFKPVFSYVKSRGFYAGINIDGTVVVERKEANAAFYGSKVSVEQIINGQIAHSQANGHDVWPAGAQNLLNTLRKVDQGALQAEGSPGLSPAAGPGHVPPMGGEAGSSAYAGPSASGGAGPGHATAGEEELPGYDERLAKPAAGDYKYA